MLGESLVVPLEDDWREALAAIARRRRWPAADAPKRLGERVAALSRAYNGVELAGADANGDAALSARLGFSFARDVPKSAGAVRELVATGLLALSPDRPLRVLDVGAGLGATTWGVARALGAAGARGTIDATWIDADARALDLGVEITRARTGADPVAITPRLVAQRADRKLPDGPFDLVLLGQTLSELDVTKSADERLTLHAALVRDLLDRTAPSGAVVIVEPALRDRTRHLHAVRDALLASAGAPTLFAPCLHAAPCPALAVEGDWCHEDLAVDLPEWLVPVAQSAGLRWQGLTFSYLVLRRDAQTLARAALPARARLRVVSGVLRSKGKREAYLCGDVGDHGGRVRAMRLDRDERAPNAAWSELSRGDLLDVTPALDPNRPRVTAETRVDVVARDE